MTEAAGLYYEEYGRPDGIPLILSAGLGGSGAYWSPNLDALARHHRVIRYDHRGTGRSDRALPATVTVAQLGDDLLALIDALGAGRADIVGHAAGGVAGLALALKAPERVGRLMLVNAWSKADPHFARCFDTRLALLRDSGPEAYLHAQPLFLYPATWISANADRLAEEEAQHLAHFAGAEAYEKRIAALRAFDVDARLASVAVPTLVIASTDDMLVPFTASQRLAAGIPGARMVTMAWGGHACNVTDPDGFNRILLAFLGE